MVIDTSVLLSIVFGEKTANWCIKLLDSSKTELIMSTVNLSEFLILLQNKQAKKFDEVISGLKNYQINFIPPDEKQAYIAAKARTDYPLNLGDCFAYALAKTEKMPIITLDKDFLKTDLTVVTI